MPVYDDFDKMLDDVKPDTVIVTTKDSMHDFYVIKALEAGCDVIVEKPMTTTFEKANAIREAEIKSDKTDRGNSGYEENTNKQAVLSGGEPVILSKSYPKVKGVVVIAEGAGNTNVKANILDAVTTAFNIASHKVCILEK